MHLTNRKPLANKNEQRRGMRLVRSKLNGKLLVVTGLAAMRARARAYMSAAAMAALRRRPAVRAYGNLPVSTPRHGENGRQPARAGVIIGGGEIDSF